MWYWYQDRQIDQRNRNKNTETNPHISEHFNNDKGGPAKQWGKYGLLVKVIGTIGYSYLKKEKTNLNPYLTLYIKMNFRCYVNLNIKDKTTKLLGEIIK